MADVVIAQSEQIDEAITAVVGHIPLQSLVAGRRVAVKPNETWASRDDTTGITQPDTLRAVLRAVRQYEPRALIVTGGAGAAETEEVFRVGGLMDVVRERVRSSSITTARRLYPSISNTGRRQTSQGRSRP